MMSFWLISAWIFVTCLFILALFAFVLRRNLNLKEYVTEATIALVLGTLIIGSFQMYVMEKQDKAEFLLDMKQSFYSSNDTNRKIIKAIENSTLKILPDATQVKGPLPANTFTEDQVDEYLINFDYMNIFIRNHMLDKKDVYWVFGWFIRKAWADRAVQSYIARIRKDERSVFLNFEQLAGDMQRMWKSDKKI